jgi:hypothetical protein
MMPMETFSITECELYWDTRKKISLRDKRIIKKELKRASVTIGRALSFLKDAALNGNEPVINFIIMTERDFFYELSLWVTNSAKSVQKGDEPLFEMNIRDEESGPAVAHIYSEKFRIALGVIEEEDQYLVADAIK